MVPLSHNLEEALRLQTSTIVYAVVGLRVYMRHWLYRLSDVHDLHLHENISHATIMHKQRDRHRVFLEAHGNSKIPEFAFNSECRCLP